MNPNQLVKSMDMLEHSLCSTALELRGYQKKVVEEALHRNTLAVLPTGSGKTLIATHVIQTRLNNLRIQNQTTTNKKLIAFLAPTKILVGQQLKYIKEHSDAVVIDFTGETTMIEGKSIEYWNRHCWVNAFTTTEVIVMTPQIMRQMLQRSFFRPDTFDLVVIDECHHALGSNPLTYICDVINADTLILAITASPLTSRKGSIVAQISQLETNLHCKLMCNDDILEEYRKIQPVASLSIFEFEPDNRSTLERLVTTPDILSQSFKDFFSFSKSLLLDVSSPMLMLYAYLRVRHTALIANVYNFVNSMQLEMDEVPEFRDANFPAQELYKLYRRKGKFLEEYSPMLGDSKRPRAHVMRSTVTTKSTSNCVELTQAFAQIIRITEECGVLSGLYAFMQCIRVKKTGRSHGVSNPAGNSTSGQPIHHYTATSSRRSKRVEFTNMFDLEKFDTMASELKKSPFNLVELFHDEYMTSVAVIDFFMAFASSLGPRICKLAAYSYVKKHTRPEASHSTCSVILHFFEGSSSSSSSTNAVTCFVPKIHALFYCLLQCVVKGAVQFNLSSEGCLVLLESAWKEHVVEEAVMGREEDDEEGIIYPFCMTDFFLREIECRSAARSASWFLLSCIPLDNLRDWAQFEDCSSISPQLAPFNLLAEDLKAANQKKELDDWQPVWFTQPFAFPIISNKVKALASIWNILADETPHELSSPHSMSEALESVMNSPRTSGDFSVEVPLSSKEERVNPVPSDKQSDDDAFIVFCRVRLVAMSIHFVLSMVISNIFDNELVPLEDFVESIPFDACLFGVKTVVDGLVDTIVWREEGIEKLIAKTELAQPPAFRPMHIVGRCNQSLQLKTLEHFKAGNYNIVFATDVMEEGLDVRACKYVINFDLPGTLKSFIQRRGRSRADNSLMISMIPYGPEGNRLMEDLSYLVRQEMEVEAHTKQVKKQKVDNCKSAVSRELVVMELSCLESSTTFEVDHFDIINTIQKLVDFDGGTDLLDGFFCGSTTKQIPMVDNEEDDPDLVAIAGAVAAECGASAFCSRMNEENNSDGCDDMDDDCSDDNSCFSNENHEDSGDDMEANKRLRNEIGALKRKRDYYLPGTPLVRPKRRRFAQRKQGPSSPIPMDSLEYVPLNPRFTPSPVNVLSGGDRFDFGEKDQDIFNKSATLKSPLYENYVVASTGAEADVRSSSQILQKFCSQLPHDEHFTPRPIFWMATAKKELQRKGQKPFQCSILLPPYVPSSIRFITGPVAPSKGLAKGLAALECVKLLHQKGELNDWLLNIASRETDKLESQKPSEQDQADYKRAKKKKLSTVLSDDIMAEIQQKDCLRNTKDLVDQNGDPIEVDSIGIDVKVTPDIITFAAGEETVCGTVLSDNCKDNVTLASQHGVVLFFYVIQAEYGDITSEEVLNKCPSCNLFFIGGNSFGLCFSRKLPEDLIEDSFRCFIREREAIDVTVDFLESRFVSDRELLHMQRFHRGMYCWEVDAVTKEIGQTFFSHRDCWIDPHYKLTKKHSSLIEGEKPINHDDWRASGNGSWYVLFPLPPSATENELCSPCAILADVTISKAQRLKQSMLEPGSIYREEGEWISFLIKTADEAQILANNLKRQEVINFEYSPDFLFGPEHIACHEQYYGMIVSRGAGGVYVVLDPDQPYNEQNPSYDADGNVQFVKKLSDISKFVEKIENPDDIIRRKVSGILQEIVNTVWMNAASEMENVENEMLDIFTNSTSYVSKAIELMDDNDLEVEEEPVMKRQRLEVSEMVQDGFREDLPSSSSILTNDNKSVFSVEDVGISENCLDRDEYVQPIDENVPEVELVNSGGEDAVQLPLSFRSRSKRKLELLLKDKSLNELVPVTFKELFQRRHQHHGEFVEKLAEDPNHRLFRVVTIVNKLTLHCLFTKTPKMTKDAYLNVASSSNVSKPAVFHTHSNPLYLLGEFCRPIGRAKHYMTGLMAPSIVWKIIGLVHADEARNEIGRIIYGFSLSKSDQNSQQLANVEEMYTSDRSQSSDIANLNKGGDNDDTFANLDKNVLKMPSVKVMFEALTPRLAGEIVDSERLELLGDSLLKLVSSVEVFRHFPTKHEGFLTSQRAKTINNLFLMETCYRLGIHKYLRAFSLSTGKQQLKVRPPGMEGWKAEKEKRQLWNVNLWVQRNLGDELVAAAKAQIAAEIECEGGPHIDDPNTPNRLHLIDDSASSNTKTFTPFGSAGSDNLQQTKQMNNQSVSQSNAIKKDSEKEVAFSSVTEYFNHKFYPKPLFEVAFVKPKIIADMVEALIGAFYVAGGELGGIAAVRALGAWPQIEQSQVEPPSTTVGNTNKSKSEGPKSNMARNRISLEFIERNENFVFPPDYPLPLKRVALGGMRKAADKEEGEEEEDLESVIDELKSKDVQRMNEEAIVLLKEYSVVYQPKGKNSATTRNGKQGLMFSRKFGVDRPSMEVISAIEEILGYRFKNWKILEEALTHCSRPDRPSNQRLEFLGDAVLDFAVVSLLFELLPWAQPGELAEFKTAATNNRNLGLIGSKLKIYRYMMFSSQGLEEEIEVLDDVIEKWELLRRKQSTASEQSTATNAPSVVIDYYTTDKSKTSIEFPATAPDSSQGMNDIASAEDVFIYPTQVETYSEDELGIIETSISKTFETSAQREPAVLGEGDATVLQQAIVTDCSSEEAHDSKRRRRCSKWDDPNPSPVIVHDPLPSLSEFPTIPTSSPTEPLPHSNRSLSSPTTFDVHGLVTKAANLDEAILDSLVKRGLGSGIALSTNLQNKEKKLTNKVTSNTASKAIADLFEALIGAVYLDCHCSMDEIRNIILHINLVPQLNELHEAKMKGLNFSLGDRGFVR